MSLDLEIAMFLGAIYSMYTYIAQLVGWSETGRRPHLFLSALFRRDNVLWMLWMLCSSVSIIHTYPSMMLGLESLLHHQPWRLSLPSSTAYFYVCTWLCRWIDGYLLIHSWSTPLCTPQGGSLYRHVPCTDTCGTTWTTDLATSKGRTTTVAMCTDDTTDTSGEHGLVEDV